MSCVGTIELFTQSVFPVEHELFAIQPRVGAGLTMFNVDFPGFSILCDQFSSTKNSIGINASVGVEFPILKGIHFGVAAGYNTRKGEFTSNSTLPAFDNTKGEYVDAQFAATITMPLTYIDISPVVRAHLFSIGKSTVRGFGACRIGIAPTVSYKQEYSIVSPSNATFTSSNPAINGKQSFVEIAEGTAISNFKAPLLLAFGIENLLPVGETSFFTQQLSYEMSLNQMYNATNVNAFDLSCIRLDLGLRFSILSKPQPPAIPVKEPEPPKTPIIAAKTEPVKPLPIFTTKIQKVDAVLQTGNELRASLPIVNAIFFEQNSSEISSKYVTENKQYEGTDAVEFHKFILPLISKILVDNPKASIVLEGATSGSAEEPMGVSLSKQRAENVQSALTALGVDRKRISIKSSTLPKTPSNQDYVEGRAENRRVDISVQEAPLQEYVARQKFAQIKGTIDVKPEAQHIETESVTIESNVTKPVNTRKNESTVIPFVQRIEETTGNFVFETNSKMSESLKSSDKISVDLALLKQEQIELSVDGFEAILRFDYNSAELSQANKDLLKQLSEKLPSGATIQILGSADILGAEQRNKELSEKRAKATEDYIKQISGSKFTISAGVSTEKFSDDSAEGRFLNRNIRIRVKN